MYVVDASLQTKDVPEVIATKLVVYGELEQVEA
jgi:hypothetical protein